MTQPMPPLNFMKWIENNRASLTPPVCNKVVYKDADFIIMVVGGPNARKDYHVDPGPEFFYQLEGSMLLKTIQEGSVVDVPINAGEIYLLPSHMPHSPQRFANGVGLVIERKRLEHEKDGLQWYCDHCTHLLYERYFTLQDIETDLPPVFEQFYAQESNRTCTQCGTVMPLPAR